MPKIPINANGNKLHTFTAVENSESVCINENRTKHDSSSTIATPSNAALLPIDSMRVVAMLTKPLIATAIVRNVACISRGFKIDPEGATVKIVKR
jgi:hypothetical protein